MKCPLMLIVPFALIPKYTNVNYPKCDCIEGECQWWNDKANYKDKEYTGECCIKTLSKLKISGDINTHPY
jgi:hypothetical protein